MAEKLPNVPDLSLPYNLNKGEAGVKQKKTTVEKQRRTRINQDTGRLWLGQEDSVARVEQWFTCFSRMKVAEN